MPFLAPAHGSRARYRKGCRCEQCRSANATYSRGVYPLLILRNEDESEKTPERPQQPQSLYTDTSRRVIRQVPIRSGSSIQSASAVPTCAHCVGLMTSTVIWPRALA